MSALGSKCARLHELNLTHDKSLGSIRALAQCKSLHTLKLQRCDAGGLQVLVDCPSLRVLNILGRSPRKSNLTVVAGFASLTKVYINPERSKDRDYLSLLRSRPDLDAMNYPG